VANELYVLNSNQILLEGLQLSYAETYVNNATVTFTAYNDATGAAITGADGVSMSYQSASNGDYLGTMDDDAELTDGKTVTVRVYGTLADGTKFRATLKCPVKARGST